MSRAECEGGFEGLGSDQMINIADIGDPPSSLAQQMAPLFQNNAVGPFLMLEALAPSLKKSHGMPCVSLGLPPVLAG